MPDFMYHFPTDTEPVTVSLETNRVTCLSKTDYRTHRWHFIKCRSNIIEMSEHKTQATSMAPRNRIEIITLRDAVRANHLGNCFMFQLEKL